MIIIKTNFYAVTGGPGGGKSTLLNALKEKGYRYVDETARLIIKERLAKGLPPRPDPIKFAEQMFEMDLENYMNNAGSSETLFFDRSFLDSAALLAEADKLIFERYRQILATHRFNTNVFITPPWKEIFANDSERDQTYEDSLRVYERLYQWYSENGYNLIVVPKTSVTARMAFVLGHIQMEAS